MSQLCISVLEEDSLTRLSDQAKHGRVPGQRPQKIYPSAAQTWTGWLTEEQTTGRRQAGQGQDPGYSHCQPGGAEPLGGR